MDRPSILTSAIRQPPPSRRGRRCSDESSDSNKLSNSKTTMMSGGKRRRSSTTRARLVYSSGGTNIESLPDKLLFEILVRLPADFLHDRARLVCPRWRRIIHSDAFINANYQQHSAYGLVLSRPPALRYKTHAIYVTATQGGRIERSDLTEICRAGGIWSACNGLAVELIDINGSGNGVPRCMRVINLATKQSLGLPLVSSHNRYNGAYYRLCGITYSAASMKYYVVIPYRGYCLDILTVGVDKSWRRLVIPAFAIEVYSSVSCRRPISSEGFFHWTLARWCLTLNVETEVFTVTEAPIPGLYKFDYLSTGRYLTLLVGHLGEFSWRVWEMRPTESGLEWREAVPSSIQLEAGRWRNLTRGSLKHVHPVGWVKYPEVLAFHYPVETNCIIYNLKTQEINTIDLTDTYLLYYSFVHRNNLVRLSQD